MNNTTKIPASFIKEIEGEGYENYIVDQFETERRLGAAGLENIAPDTTGWTLFDLLYFLDTH